MNVQERASALLAGKGENYIFPFFWQHGEDEAVLRAYMNVIYQANIRAVCVESRPHEDFVGPKWWADMDAILDEAQTLGMQVWILDDKHFPTGYAAGAVEHAPQELCHQYLDYNTADVCGPMQRAELNVAQMAHPRPTPPWMPPSPAPKRVFNDDYIYKVLACSIESGGVIGTILDLTDAVRDGTLIWDVPAGYWKIYVTYLTRDAKGRNDYINFLDAKSCRLLIDAVYEPHYTHYKHLFGNTIAGFFSDEPPIGNTPGYTPGDLIGKPNMPLSWSAAMPARMQEAYGADWACQLPLLWAQGADQQNTARIRVAYMDAVSKLVAECFSGQLGAWCEQRGVEYIGHMLEDCDSSANLGPSMGHFFRGLSGQHMAGIDNIGGQVLIGGQHVWRRPGGMCQDDAGFYHYMNGRMGASMAAIDPKKKGRCMCENFGAYGWQIGVRTEKYLTDHFLARGVNRYVPHAFTPKPFPDPDCPPHFFAHGENPQYRAFGELMAYTNRVCHLIDGGACVARVALLYHGESQWAGSYESNILACRELTRHQISFVLIPADVFAQPEAYHTVYRPEDHVLSINGIECGVLVISGCAYLPAAAARFAAQAAEGGFPVVFTGRLPDGVSDAAPEESARLCDALRGAAVTPVRSLAQTLQAFVAPDVVTETPWEDLTVYHYKNGTDLYVFLNEHPSDACNQTITLRNAASAVRYDAWENRLRALPAQRTGNDLRITLVLAPLEMAVVLCDTELAADAEMPLRETQVTVLENVTVACAQAKEYPNFGAPQAADLRVGMGGKMPHFSGFFRYETTVTLKPCAKTVLQIENVYESAEVFVDGVSAGMKTAQPYRYDITPLVRDGSHAIRIDVATTLERKVAAIGADVACMNLPAPLSPTGILGDIIITSYDK